MRAKKERTCPDKTRLNRPKLFRKLRKPKPLIRLDIVDSSDDFLNVDLIITQLNITSDKNISLTLTILTN